MKLIGTQEGSVVRVLKCVYHIDELETMGNKYGIYYT